MVLREEISNEIKDFILLQAMESMYIQMNKMIFSQVNEYGVLTCEKLFSPLVSDYFGCLHCFTNK